MTYPQALQYLESFVNYEKQDNYDYKKSFKLDGMKRIVSFLGNPQDNIRSIHIAGTKGKGSTSAMVHSILKAAGFKVGLYTSPHLVSFRERIRINDSMIGEDDVAGLIEPVKKAVSSLSSDEPSFFEVYTALAYLYFKEKKVDFAIYEVGLGGRLDATNVVEPMVCAITPISYEHTQKLGNTLTEIAREKAGIIKDGGICVSAPQEKEAQDVIERVCRDRTARLIRIGKDIFFEELMTSCEKETFSVFGIFGEYPVLEMDLLGSHQIVNAATAIGIIECLRSRGVVVSSDAIRAGIASARWPGRLEVVSRRPLAVLDGAQNRASANALAAAIRKIFFKERRPENLILVLGVSKDKDIKGILEELLPISGVVILTKSRVTERACEPSAIKGMVDSPGKAVILTSGVKEATEKALAAARPSDMILVTGSLFVVGEAREFLMAKLNQQQPAYA